MEKKIIFIGGIHGVGKTTICKLSVSFGIKHWSASDLIYNENRKKLSMGKRVNNIAGNQELLVDAVDRHLPSDKVSLIDGHFCLINQRGEIEKIPLSTFAVLKPVAILVLFSDAQLIVQRLKIRDQKNYQLEWVKNFQTQEGQYSEYVACTLGISYLQANV